SIVRGTTLRRIVGHLRDAGAKEIHVCAASPEVKYSCYFGIDTPHREKLIAVQKSPDEICEYLGADSLTYLSEESLREVCCEDSYCKACFDGNYPMEVPINGGDLL
ncbi:MAG: amidophosphoribosyltransferase, partial [Synergistaceae bacterium]|nr:amidophosphoribosyltransferase [Synergistaceae bacterium]